MLKPQQRSSLASSSSAAASLTVKTAREEAGYEFILRRDEVINTHHLLSSASCQRRSSGGAGREAAAAAERHASRRRGVDVAPRSQPSITFHWNERRIDDVSIFFGKTKPCRSCCRPPLPPAVTTDGMKKQQIKLKERRLQIRLKMRTPSCGF